MVLFLFQTHNLSETGFCDRLQVEPTQLGLIDRVVPISEHQHQYKIGILCRFHLKGTDSSLSTTDYWRSQYKSLIIVAHPSCVHSIPVSETSYVLNNSGTMDDVQKHNNCIC
jgi:hypothetical protein